MGSFSFLRADRKTKKANIMEGDTIKLLIPEKFGGGFIKAIYNDYGKITLCTPCNANERYDVYELVALWNKDMQITSTRYIKDDLNINAPFISLKTIDDTTRDNRSIGIRIASDMEKAARLDYPLKLVSASCKDTYETCPYFSVSDPQQGFSPLFWEKMHKERKTVTMLGRFTDKYEKSQKLYQKLHGMEVMNDDTKNSPRGANASANN